VATIRRQVATLMSSPSSKRSGNACPSLPVRGRTMSTCDDSRCSSSKNAASSTSEDSTDCVAASASTLRTCAGDRAPATLSKPLRVPLVDNPIDSDAPANVDSQYPPASTIWPPSQNHVPGIS
jgi:hypothetical protein